jgi:hypothetical protein
VAPFLPTRAYVLYFSLSTHFGRAPKLHKGSGCSLQVLARLADGKAQLRAFRCHPSRSYIESLARSQTFAFLLSFHASKVHIIFTQKSTTVHN